MARLIERLDEDCVVCVPYFDEDVHDVDGPCTGQLHTCSGPAAERREILEKSRRLTSTDRG